MYLAATIHSRLGGYLFQPDSAENLQFYYMFI